MNILIVIFLITSFISFESAITVYRLNRRSRKNRLYAIAIMTYTLFSLAYMQFMMAPDIQACGVWFRVSIVFLIMFFVLITHFFLEVTRFRELLRSRLFITGLYLSGLLAIAITTATSLVVAGFTRTPWGWNCIYRIDSPVTWVVMNFLVPCLVLCTIGAARWRRRAEGEREKKQALIILCIAAAGCAYLVIQNLMPLFLSPDMQAVAGNLNNHLISLALIFAIRYAIWKYKLMTIIPDHPASELFTGMTDAIFLTNCRGDVVFMNEFARTIAGGGASTKKRSLFDLFSTSKPVRNEFVDMAAGTIPIKPITISRRVKGCAALDLNLHAVKNEEGTCVGMLVIARENTGIAEIQDHHSLTGRELEVFLLIVEGLSAQEVSDELGISLQTAKSHIHNIYRKTGLRNRVELANLMNKSG